MNANGSSSFMNIAANACSLSVEFDAFVLHLQ